MKSDSSLCKLVVPLRFPQGSGFEASTGDTQVVQHGSSYVLSPLGPVESLWIRLLTEAESLTNTES